jgi:hypothetical protein
LTLSLKITSTRLPISVGKSQGRTSSSPRCGSRASGRRLVSVQGVQQTFDKTKRPSRRFRRDCRSDESQAKSNAEYNFGCSRSRFPPGLRRYAKSPAATPGTEVACANSRTVAMPPLCSVLRYALLALLGRTGRLSRRIVHFPRRLTSKPQVRRVWNLGPCWQIWLKTERQIAQPHGEIAHYSLASTSAGTRTLW